MAKAMHGEEIPPRENTTMSLKMLMQSGDNINVNFNVPRSAND